MYDFVEELYRDLSKASHQFWGKDARWQELVNEYFVEEGVGWQMVDGLLETRGSGAFTASVRSADANLARAGLSTAQTEIREAVHDLSRRPEPDLTGAVQHAMAALECTAREVAGGQKSTLGEILKRYPGLLPRPLDEALTKLWGYASETGRHLSEGRTPTRDEVELIVGVASSSCTYLSRSSEVLRMDSERHGSAASSTSLAEGRGVSRTPRVTASGGGGVVRPQLPIALDEDSEPEPDLVVVPGHARDFSSAHPSSVTLIVEVADTSLAFDRGDKASLYARAGVADYWIVNLIDRVVEVHRDPSLAPAATYGWQYGSRRLARPGDVVAPLVLAAASVPVVDLLP